MMIGFGHKSGVGKDTCCKHLVAYHGFVHYAFADQLKHFAYEIFGHLGLRDKAFYDENRDEKYKIIEYLGYTAVSIWVFMNKFRDLYPALWISHLEKNIIENEHTDRDICISDVRQKNEAQWIQVMHNGFVVLLTSVKAPIITEAKTDTKLDNFPDWDGHIKNDLGHEDLYFQIECLLYKFRTQKKG